MQPAWKHRNLINNKTIIKFTHQKRKINNFLLKTLPPQNIVPNLMFIIWNSIAIFKLNIVYLELLDLNLPEEMKYDAEDLSKNVRKTRDRTSLNKEQQFVP